MAAECTILSVWGVSLFCRLLLVPRVMLLPVLAFSPPCLPAKELLPACASGRGESGLSGKRRHAMTGTFSSTILNFLARGRRPLVSNELARAPVVGRLAPPPQVISGEFPALLSLSLLRLTPLVALSSFCVLFPYHRFVELSFCCPPAFFAFGDFFLRLFTRSREVRYLPFFFSALRLEG